MLEMARLSKPVNIQLKMNSGMNRLGYTPERYPRGVGAGARLPGRRPDHADDPFLRRRQRARRGSPDGSVRARRARHRRRRAASLTPPRRCGTRQSHFDWVRPGIILYGASPSGVSAAIPGTGLQPRHDARVGTDRRAEHRGRSDTVGYGSLFKARGPDAHWRGRVRLCGRLSAGRARRHAGDRATACARGSSDAFRWTC